MLNADSNGSERANACVDSISDVVSFPDAGTSNDSVESNDCGGKLIVAVNESP